MIVAKSLIITNTIDEETIIYPEVIITVNIHIEKHVIVIHEYGI